MILQYTDIFAGGKSRRIKGELTTEHSASSYGLPVIILPDGGVLSAESWVMLGYGVVSLTQKEAPLMERWLKNLFAMYGIAESPAAALGRKGGAVKSDRKTAAARENGKKGGAPWQNWVVGDEPVNCIPLGNQTAEEHGMPAAVKVVRARSAEEAIRKSSK
jgi:hypothetical protein